MIPNKVNNVGEAKQAMKQIGIDNSFLDNIAGFVKPIASKFGIKSEMIDKYSQELRSTDNTSPVSPNNSSFNRNKYPKI